VSFVGVRFEEGGLSSYRQVFLSPAPGASTGREWADKLQSAPLRTDGFSIAWIDSSVTKVEGNQIQVDGKIKTRFAYLVQVAPITLRKGSLLVARGQLTEGGFALGALKDDKWHNQVAVSQSGKFVAAVEILEDGTFVPMITNSTARDGIKSLFTITEFGILEPAPSK